MKYILLPIFLLLSLVSLSLNAQTNTKNQIWVDAVTSFGFLDVDPFKLGFGGGVQLSIDKPLHAKSAIGIHLGASRMGSYNRVYGEYSYDVLPNGYQQIEQTTKLQAFGFIDAGLHFKHRPNLKSPWSWSVGASTSLITQAVGEEYNRSSINLTETAYEASTVSSSSTSRGSLEQEDFSSYDISAEATLYYEITKGCALRASFRQGTRNLIKPTVSPHGDAQHFLSMITVGFSARLR